MKRTLIVAQGLERERIIAAVSLHSPNKLIILRSKKDITEELKKYVDRHIMILKDEILPKEGKTNVYPFLLEIDDQKKVDFFDLPSAISEIDSIVKKEISEGKDVAVDISSGNKIINIALFIVAQRYGLKVTYCAAGKYASMKEGISLEETNPEQIAFSVKEHYDIPRIPINIEPIPINVLKALETLGGEVDSIIKLARVLYSKNDVGKREHISISRKLDVLLEYGYVTKRRRGRKYIISITSAGRKILSLQSIF